MSSHACSGATIVGRENGQHSLYISDLGSNIELAIPGSNCLLREVGEQIVLVRHLKLPSCETTADS